MIFVTVPFNKALLQRLIELLNAEGSDTTGGDSSNADDYMIINLIKELISNKEASSDLLPLTSFL